jgi:hypothetical protein
MIRTKAPFPCISCSTDPESDPGDGGGGVRSCLEFGGNCGFGKLDQEICRENKLTGQEGSLLKCKSAIL